ncbi:ParB/RepB/Spo0J family partition protein [Glacieibacterium megasporae]|uniref:ParB/RepB/Spo0J family partition protein n=1 Tax=Glacieibacterium megasporae TaxID=2835787 RepID=UPI001C1E8341|nr:ParB/RepB/Spo0J family partition protein [Polymorphobacter megasporae]UAJ12741.1 ParB/RepB/Spo0J family partition protein [Polymorphobacter megasporae]
MGNKGFGDRLADSYVESARDRPARGALPTDSVVASRSSAFTELATGKVVNDRTLWVDPARCRLWEHHNRDQALLDEVSCADLIDSFKAEGKQRLPAIVRRVKGDPDVDFEIIAGARRHWTVMWLRSHNYPNFEFLVTVLALTDEEAFRLADVENRARQDLSDLERARDYAKALTLFYGNKQADMATRLNLQTAWLSRLLDLAALPPEIIACFADPRELKVEHAKVLGPLLRQPLAARKLLAEARDLADAQAGSLAAGQPTIRPADIVRQLQRATLSRSVRPAAVIVDEWQSKSGRPMMRATRGQTRTTVVLPTRSGATRADLVAAFAELLDRLKVGEG